MDNWHQSQRGYFAGALYEQMQNNENIYLLVGDLGYGMFDKCFKTFPDRCINCGASEQAMMGIAVGLAQEGKIPFVYTITSFFLRAAETISLYLYHEQANVKLVGSGRDQDYAHDGFSHDAESAQDFLGQVALVSGSYPETKEEIPEILELMIKESGPMFISLKR